MRRQQFLAILFSVIFGWSSFALAGGNETVQTMPSSNASFLQNTQDFLRQEVTSVTKRSVPNGSWVGSGGLHGTAGSCTSSSFSTDAVTTAGNHITGDGGGGTVSINYAAANLGANCANPGSAVCWVAGSALGQSFTASGSRSVVSMPTLPSSNFNRVGSSNLYADCASVAQPALPSDSVYLMKTTITNGAIATVADLRVPSSLSREGVYDVTDTLYGAVPNDSTDATTAIQSVLTAVTAQGGGVVYLPLGTYKVSSTLAVTAKTTIRGAGRRASIVHATHSGDGIRSNSPINGSTAVNIRLENIGIKSDAGNTGGGYVDVAGTFVDLYQVQVNSFKYGVIFDQTELGTIDSSEFSNQFAAGGGIWLVNDADHTGGASPNFTNRIAITRNQINQGTTAYGIIEDGGSAHTIQANNFEGGLQNLRICGLRGSLIDNNEFENSTSTAITFQNTTLAGTANASITNAQGVVLNGNFISPHLGQVQILVTTGDSIALIGNRFGSDNTVANRVVITSLTQLTALSNLFTGGPSNGGSYSGSATYEIQQDGNLTADAKIFPGFQLKNTGTGNTGVVTGVVMEHYEEGTFTPTFTATASSFTYAANGQKGYYTKIGNRVFYSILIQLAAAGNVLANNPLFITGLPYTSHNGTNNTPIAPVEWVSLATAMVSLVGQVDSSNTRIRLSKTTAASISQIGMSAQDLDATAGSFLAVSGNYMTQN